MKKEETEEKDIQTIEEKEDNEATVEETVDIKEKDKKPKKEKSKVADLKAELDEQKDKYLRLYSEFENFRRRSAKERLELISTASASLMEELLPVLDDLERAVKSFDQTSDEKALQEGVQLVQTKFKTTLTNKGLKEMELEAGSDFDAEYHEAVTKIPAPKDKLKGKIVDVIEKGYVLGEKVIRYAKVVIGE